jgi:tetratricopeptide (TPR) repeat protein
MARAYRDAGKLAISSRLFDETISQMKLLGYSENLYLIYYHSSLLFSDYGNFGESLHYIRMSQELAVSGGVEKWFMDVTDGHKSYLLTVCGKAEEGLEIAQKLLSGLNASSHYLFSGALFYTGITFMINRQYQNAEKCFVRACQISSNAQFRIIECYSAGLLSHIYHQTGKTSAAEDYAYKSVKLAADGGYLQGFITIPQMLDCIIACLIKGEEKQFISKVLQGLKGTMQFENLLSEIQTMIFTKGENEQQNVFNVIESLIEAGVRIPGILVFTFGSMAVYAAGKGFDTDGWRTKKEKELFAYLLNRKGKAVLSEKLVAELWPGTKPEKAKNLLYTNIAYLKGKLGRWGLGNSLVKEQNGYYLRTEGILCDKWLLDDELERIKHAHGNIQKGWLAALAHKGYMDGFYSDWVTEEQNDIDALLEKER